MTSEVMTCTTDGSPESRRDALPSAFAIRAVFWPPYAIIPLSVCPVRVCVCVSVFLSVCYYCFFLIVVFTYSAH